MKVLCLELIILFKYCHSKKTVLYNIFSYSFISVKRSVTIEAPSIYKPPVVSLNSSYVQRGDENKDCLPSLVDYTPTLTTTQMKRNDNKIWNKLGFKLVILAIVVRIIHIFKLGYLFGEVRLYNLLIVNLCAVIILKIHP